MIISRTPLRVSFFGGGTDYPAYFQKHGGAVLGTAIQSYGYHSCSYFHSQLFDYAIRVGYRRVECAKSLSEIEHAPFRECLKSVGIDRDIEVDYTAELPSMTGLGSSSSFVVGLLKVLNAYRGVHVSPLDLAYKAIELEQGTLGDTVGCQDQTFAAVGGLNVLEFRATDNIVVHRLALTENRMAELSAHLLLFFTGIKRRAAVVARSKVQRFDESAPHLREMRRLVDEGYELLTSQRPMSELGPLLHKAWSHKRALSSSVSNTRIEEIYETALGAGALGGKLLGAGGGGFVLLCVPPERQDGVRCALGDLHEVPLRINAPGAHIIHG